MHHGIIIIEKEKGFTSHDVVAKLRGIFKQKKIGHTGTLDPDATGVLPVCLGNATKVCDLLTDKDKTYEAVLRLGITTDTQDITGEIIKEQEVCVSKETVWSAISSFIGEYDQVPPMYSALKVNGKKLYELAREGKIVERKARRVNISEINLLEADEEKGEYRIEVSCSKGTYVRTLCHDIGEKLGCGGVMAELRRTRVGNFRIEEALTLSEVEAAVKNGDFSVLRDVDSVFLFYPAGCVKKEAEKWLWNGNPLRKDQVVLVEDGDREVLCRKEEKLKQAVGKEQHGQKEAKVAKAIGIGQPSQEEGEDAGIKNREASFQPWIRIYSSDGQFTAIYEIRKKEYFPVKMFL